MKGTISLLLQYSGSSDGPPSSPFQTDNSNNRGMSPNMSHPNLNPNLHPASPTNGTHPHSNHNHNPNPSESHGVALTLTVPPSQSLPPMLTLRVSSFQVKGLQSFSLIGSANPYLSVSLGSQRQKTTVLWGRAQGHWEGHMDFSLPAKQLESAYLTVRVFDKERIRRKRLLGAVAVKLVGLHVPHVFVVYLVT